MRLWMDDSLVIDEWRKMEATEFMADVALSAGNHVVQMEHYEDNEEALAELWWEGL